MPGRRSRQDTIQLRTVTHEGLSRIGYIGHTSQHPEDAPMCLQDGSTEAELHANGFWWCSVEAWYRGAYVCNSHYEGFQGQTWAKPNVLPKLFKQPLRQDSLCRQPKSSGDFWKYLDNLPHSIILQKILKMTKMMTLGMQNC